MVGGFDGIRMRHRHGGSILTHGMLDVALVGRRLKEARINCRDQDGDLQNVNVNVCVR